jgi:molybdopterin/thiamine biosynthesis adenylyltransferase
MKFIYIIGAGGVGSWLAPAMKRLAGLDTCVEIIDGDKLEPKNLDRQLFNHEDIGRFKSEALAKKYNCDYCDRYYSHGTVCSNDRDWFMVCVDNNAGRRAVLETCDTYGSRAIFGANETTSAEAYFYDPSMKGTERDPRVYYPEILTDSSGDPRAEAIGCTGQAQENNRQLVSANFMAAALMQHLYVLWAMEKSKMDTEALGHFPYRIRQNLTNYELTKLKG